MPRKAPEHTVLVRAGEVRLEDAAMLERQARRAERQWKRDHKVGHQLGATWLRAAASMLRQAATMDRRYMRPYDPPSPEPTSATKASARQRVAKRR